jgi:hypothetical protein
MSPQREKAKLLGESPRKTPIMQVQVLLLTHKCEPHINDIG